MIEGIFRHKKIILAAFALMTVISLVLAPHVRVNYNLLDYLPADSPSTVAVNKMSEVYGETDENGLRVMAAADDLPEAARLMETLAALDGVESIRWLNDAVDITQPISFIDDTTLEQWYRDGYALYKVQLKNDETGKDTAATLDRIRAVIGSEGAMAGGAVNSVAAKQNTGDELETMMLLLIPFLLVIMLLSTTSWFEPVLFLIVIGAALLFNSATNVFLGQISFVTQTAAAVLQLAVSMDYSIFLLHRFRDFRQDGLEPLPAIKSAMKSAYPTIIASGLTTVFGFAALVLMRFLIGADMGLVLAKGVILSLLSVIFLLPILTMLSYKLIDKTTHRNLIPSFKKTGRLVTRIGVPLIILMLAVVVPSYLAQQSNTFIYGESTITGDADSQAGHDDQAIRELFGSSNQLVLIIPDTSLLTEKELADELVSLPYVTDVSSFAVDIGTRVPPESVPPDVLSQLIQGGYSRMVLSLDAPSESAEALSTVEDIREMAGQYYGEYYLTGSSANVYDMKEVTTADNRVVNLAAIAAISIVIALTFKSVSLPIILVACIETSIWLNLSVPYFTGEPIVYIGYIIISSIQLGATVDYAILLSGRYMERRRSLPPGKAAAQAVSETLGSILTSASILFGAGLIISSISTSAVISQLGSLIGRGAALSCLIVVLVLPNILRLLDRLIVKTTLNTGFTEVIK